MRRFLFALLSLLILSVHLPAAVLQSDYQALIDDHSLTDTERLHRLFDLDWKRGMEEAPEFATSVGYPGFDDQWTDSSWAAIQARKAEDAWPLQVMKAIDRTRLPAADRLNYDLYRRASELGLEGQRFPSELLAISQLGGVHQGIPQVLEQMPRETAKDYESILARLRKAPEVIAQNQDLLQRGLAAGVTPPKITLRDVPEQILDVIPDDPAKSPLLVPFQDFPPSLPEAEQKRLKAEAEDIYRTQLVPAFRKFHDFVKNEYLPKTRDSIATSALPDGPAWYAYAVRSNTTTDLTPEQIHQMGLEEVKRVREAMDAVIAETKFKGKREEFLRFVETDPQFYYTDRESLLAGYRDIAKRADPELTTLFGKLPRTTYGVKAVPEYAEESAPAAYYQDGSLVAGRPGWFCANTSNLPGRPKWQMECLTLHEAVPGHHLQISLAQEMGDVPEFRKYAGYTAYTEGWGLYAESLGPEMGFYKDPYSKYGALTFEMWRAARLVIDTGIHALGWTRDQAIAYMMENVGKNRHEAEVEVDRYIVWPGQALAYKIGQFKIRELRALAERELGERFDLRAFHDAMLADGALPLDVLEAKMKDWIAAQKQAGAKP